MTARTVVAVTGALVVTAYAVLLALDALVLDPLAAVPGKSLAEISARVDAMGNSVQQDVVGVLVIAGLGIALGIGGALVGLRDRIPTHMIAPRHVREETDGRLSSVRSSCRR